jgi:hypothetical protein
MNEQDKIILKDLVEQVKNGTLDVNDLPLKWRELVQAQIEVL